MSLIQDIPCIIFAGGKSSRMGQDKSLLPFGGETSLALYQYKRMKKIFSKVYISSKEDKFDFDADFIFDPVSSSAFAPTAGFVALFDAITENRAFVLSVDTPFVGETEIQKLINEDNDDLDAVIAKTDEGSHPMCGIYHRTLHKTFKQMLQDDVHKLGMLLKNSNTKFVYFEEEHPFSNLNHPHEYEKALEVLKK